MEQVNVYAFFALGRWLDSAYLTIHERASSNIHAFKAARSILEALLSGRFKFQLDVSRESADRMVRVLERIVAACEATPDEPIPDELRGAFISEFDILEQHIGLEAGRAPVFFVPPKGVYATRALIADAASVYEGYRHRIPAEAVSDTNQAGRCLAFGLATASGFHIARAVESVMRMAMSRRGCPALKDSQRNWGQYIDALKDKGTDPRVIGQLRQMKDLHRNPMVHPDVTIGHVEALSLWAMGTSVIQALVADVEQLQTDPSAEISAMLPPPEVAGP